MHRMQLQEFVAICINEANLNYGKQITSVSEDALAPALVLQLAGQYLAAAPRHQGTSF